MEILCESLDDIYSRYYQSPGKGHIDRDEFDVIIAIDPTFEPNADKLGNYGKWLLSLKINDPNSFRSTQEMQEFRDQLEIFDQHKRGYDPSDRDIGHFRSLQDLIDVNHKYDANESSVDSIKAQRVDGLEFVGQTADWELYIPRTWEASKYIRGDNAVWCTGRKDRSDYFDSYTRNDRYLLVFINKRNRDDKYQASVYPDGNLGEFKDARNKSQSIEIFFSANPDILDLLKVSKYNEIADAISDRIAMSSGIVNLHSGIITGGKAIVTAKKARQILDFFSGKEGELDDQMISTVVNNTFSSGVWFADDMSIDLIAEFWNNWILPYDSLQKIDVYMPKNLTAIPKDILKNFAQTSRSILHFYKNSSCQLNRIIFNYLLNNDRIKTYKD